MPDEVLFNPSLEEAYVESERNWQRSLQQIADDPNLQERIFVAENETGAVVGLAMGGTPKQELLPNSGEVYALYMLPNQQGHGLGRRLVQAVVDHLAQLGMTSLLIGCLAVNTPARRFYEVLGGRVVAERQTDEGGILLPEVVYGWEELQVLIHKEEVK